MSVEEQVKKIIMEQLGVTAEEVKPEASFVEDLGADSLDLTELIRINKKLNIFWVTNLTECIAVDSYTILFKVKMCIRDRNRLDHAINSLEQEGQDMTAALSRIEDVDMAGEMTEYTKDNAVSYTHLQISNRDRGRYSAV